MKKSKAILSRKGCKIKSVVLMETLEIIIKKALQTGTKMNIVVFL